MKNILYILALFAFLLSCDNSDLAKEKTELVEFNNFLGKEKSESLDLMVKSLDDFLDHSCPNEISRQDKFEAFIRYVSKNSTIDSNWVFDTESNIKILKKFEKSGMRKEIYLYSKEKYIPTDFIENISFSLDDTSVSELSPLILDLEDDSLVPIAGLDSLELIKRAIETKRIEKEIHKRFDSVLWFNNQGKFLVGLSKFAVNDSLIYQYVHLKLTVGHFTSLNLHNLGGKLNYESPWAKRIMIADLYFHMIKADIERNKTKR